MDAHKALRVLSTRPSREEMVHDMLKSIIVSSLFSSDNTITSLLLLATSALPFPTCSWSTCHGKCSSVLTHSSAWNQASGKRTQQSWASTPWCSTGSEDGPSVLKSGKEKWEGKRGWEGGSNWSRTKLRWCQECSNFCLQGEKQRYLIWFKINTVLALGWCPTVTFIGIFLRPFPLQHCTPCILSHSEMSCGWDNLPHSAVVTQHLLATSASQLGPLVPDQIIWFGHQIKD